MSNKHQGPSHLIEQLRKAGNTDSYIAKLLNVSGVLNSHGLGWTKEQVAQVAIDRAAITSSESEADILETMKHLRELGQSYQQIADRLSAMGHITRRGGQWRVP